jgi:hypothetical protein
MRKVCTGHAVFYNKRHERRGYVLQERYKSIPVESDAYLLELLRYIHLNPLRKGIVRSLEELERYLWTGHSALCRIVPRPWQTTGDILALFAPDKHKAIRAYREFVRDGVRMRGMPSSAGDVASRIARSSETEPLISNTAIEVEDPSDDGRSEAEAFRRTQDVVERGDRLRREGWTLERLAERICDLLHLHPDELWRKGRENRISIAKGVICYIARRELGMTSKDISGFLGVSSSAVSQAAKRGERFIRENGLQVLP